MRRKLLTLSAASVTVLLMVYFSLILLSFSYLSSSHALAFSSGTATPTSTSSTSTSATNSSSSWFDQNAQGILTVFGILLTFFTFLPTGFAFYQTQRLRQLELEHAKNEATREAEARQHDRDMADIHQQHERVMEELRQQHERDKEEAHWQHERDLVENRQQHERDMEEMRKEHEEALILLKEEIGRHVKNQARNEEEEERIRTAKLTIQSIQEQYCRALRADPHIAFVQILGMKDSLRVEDVYVHMRVLREVKGPAGLDMLQLSEKKNPGTPEEVYRKELEQLRNRVNAAMMPDDAIRKFPRCVIVGDPGAGKTMLLKYLALRAVDDPRTELPPVPIYIELNAFAVSEYRDLLDFAAAQWEQKYNIPKVDARNFMEENLKVGHAMLLLDALDETIIGQSTREAEESYQRVAKAVLNLSPRYALAPIVVTARKAGYQHRPLLKGFSRLEVLDFRPEDIRHFVHNWFDDSSSSNRQQDHAHAIELTAKLERNSHVLSLASNPLLLSLIVIVYQTQHNLPERRAELYRRCVETLTYAWDMERNINRRREFTLENKMLLLKEIAWHFHSHGLRYFPENELLQVIADFMPAIGLPAEENGRVLREIANENGLLRSQASNLYGFLHLTLQEYFVAQYLHEHNQLDQLLTFLGDPWWEEVVLLYVGNTPDISPLLYKLLGQNGEPPLHNDIFQTNLILAGQCLTARPTIRDISLRENIIEQLFDVLLSTPHSLTKEQCIEVLVAIGGYAINARLLSLLADETTDKLTRLRIVRAMGIGGERIVVYDLMRLLQDRNIHPGIRAIIAETIGVMNDPAVAPGLLRVLDTPHLEADLHELIVKILGMLGNHHVSYDLLHRLQKGHLEQHIRCSIAETLGKLGDHSTAHTLLELLTKDTVPLQVRCSIADGLGIMGNSSIVRNLVALLSQDQIDQQVRCHIAEAVGKLKDPTIVPDLWKIHHDPGTNPYIAKTISVALGRLGELAAIPHLLALLTDSTIELHTRRQAVDVLCALDGLKVSADLLHLLNNAEVAPSVRREIVEALSNLGNKALIHELETLLADEHVDRIVRQSIAHAMGKIGNHSVVPVLLDLLRDIQDTYVCRSILDALGAVGDRVAVAPLLSLLSDLQINQRVRESAANVIGRLANDLQTVKTLGNLIDTSDIADHIYRALWLVSRRAGIRVVRNTYTQTIELEEIEWRRNLSMQGSS